MNKDENIGFSWIVKKCNTNENVIKDYNVLENREDFIRKLKKNILIEKNLQKNYVVK